MLVRTEEEQLYTITDIQYSLDGNRVVGDGLGLERRLRILKSCDSNGSFNPSENLPYPENTHKVELGKEMKLGCLTEHMDKTNQMFRNAKLGKVEGISYGRIITGDVWTYEWLSFSQWQSIGRPDKIRLAKEYRSAD